MPASDSPVKVKKHLDERFLLAHNDPMMMTLGEQVRSLRRRRGYTQEELGARLGRSKNWVYNLERDRAKVSFDELGALVAELGALYLPPPSEAEG